MRANIICKFRLDAPCVRGSFCNECTIVGRGIAVPRLTVLPLLSLYEILHNLDVLVIGTWTLPKRSRGVQMIDLVDLLVDKKPIVIYGSYLRDDNVIAAFLRERGVPVFRFVNHHAKYILSVTHDMLALYFGSANFTHFGLFRSFESCIVRICNLVYRCGVVMLIIQLINRAIKVLDVEAVDIRNDLERVIEDILRILRKLSSDSDTSNADSPLVENIREIRRLKRKCDYLHARVTNLIYGVYRFEDTKLLRKFVEDLENLISICGRCLREYSTYFTIGREEDFSKNIYPRYVEVFREYARRFGIYLESVDTIVEELKYCYNPEIAKEVRKHVDEIREKLHKYGGKK